MYTFVYVYDMDVDDRLGVSEAAEQLGVNRQAGPSSGEITAW